MERNELIGSIIFIAFTCFVFGMVWQIIISPTWGEVEELKSCARMADAGYDINLTERGCDVNDGKYFQQVNYICAKHIGMASTHCYSRD